jgi:hypothetical protein
MPQQRLVAGDRASKHSPAGLEPSPDGLKA